MSKKINLRPNKALAALLSGQRRIVIPTISDLDGITDALGAEGMEEFLFPGSTARKIAAAKYLAEAPLSEIVQMYSLSEHLPLTMGQWATCSDEALLRKRILWVLHYLQCAAPVINEYLIRDYEGQQAGTPLWEICPH